MRITPTKDIVNFFRQKHKLVLTFAGFGELGYQNSASVELVIKELLNQWQPHEILVNCGTLLRVGGEEGIASVYRLAKEMEIETSGIHPGVSLEWEATHPVSPFADHVFFVDDNTWGGYLNERQDLSPTLKLLLEITDELIVIGGGKHAADELAAFIQHGKKVRYFPAQMNHRVTENWCKKADVDISDLNGAAYSVWMGRPGNSTKV